MRRNDPRSTEPSARRWLPINSTRVTRGTRIGDPGAASNCAASSDRVLEPDAVSMSKVWGLDQPPAITRWYVARVGGLGGAPSGLQVMQTTNVVRGGNGRDLVPGANPTGSAPSAGPRQGPASASALALDLALAAGDEGSQLGGDGRIQVGGLERGQEPFPDAVGPLRRGSGAIVVPGLEVAPVGDQRPVEGRLVALEGVGRPEEVAAGAHVDHRLEAQLGLVDRERDHHLGHIWRISASMISFSNEAVRPPSSQPAPW